MTRNVLFLQLVDEGRLWTVIATDLDRVETVWSTGGQELEIHVTFPGPHVVA